MQKLVILLAAAVLLCGFTAGCARIEAKEKSIELQDSTRAYRKAIRWSEFDIAKEFIRRRDGSGFDYDKSFHEGIKVTSMEIVKHDVSLEALEARVTAELSYYHVDRGSVKSIVDTELWWYDPETERWYLDGGFPDFAGGLTN